MSKWMVSTKNIDIVVDAEDQWEAFAALKTREPEEFGMVVEAQRADQTGEEAFSVRTSHLFGKWGRNDIAVRFIKQAIAMGLPDTGADDLLQEVR